MFFIRFLHIFMAYIKKGLVALLMLTTVLSAPDRIIESDSSESISNIQFNYVGFSADNMRRAERVKRYFRDYKFDHPFLFKETPGFRFDGQFHGITNAQYFIEVTDLNSYRFRQNIEQSSKDLWSVPSVREPIENLFLHEIGHAIFGDLGKSDKKDLERLFFQVDCRIPPNSSTNFFAHPSFESYFYRFYQSDTETNTDSSMLFVNEQFAEIFTYITLKHHYKDYDSLFMEKKKAVETVLKDVKEGPKG